MNKLISNIISLSRKTTKADDNNGLVLPSLLGEDGTMRYTDGEDRVTKIAYRPMLERLQSNVSIMIINYKKVEITNNRYIISFRIVVKLIRDKEETITIIII